MSVTVTFPTAHSLTENAQYVPVSVVLVDDSIPESNETFTISLSNAVNGFIITDWFNTATGTIFDDDGRYFQE